MKYFAYGVNLNKNIMKGRCSQARPLLSATLPNYKLFFIGWSREWRGGVATIRPVRGEKVPGGVWEISEADARQLDRSEGFPAVYTKINVRVFDDSGAPIDAYTYVKVAQDPVSSPSKEYGEIIAQGYRDWGLT